MRAVRVQASLCIRAVSPEPPLLTHTSNESRGTYRQKPRSLPPRNGWACAVKICHDGMLEDTNSLDGAQLSLRHQVNKNDCFTLNSCNENVNMMIWSHPHSSVCYISPMAVHNLIHIFVQFSETQTTKHIPVTLLQVPLIQQMVKIQHIKELSGKMMVVTPVVYCSQELKELKLWRQTLTVSMDSVDIVHGLSGHCPWTQWTLSMDSVDIVHGLSGHGPWTLVPILQQDNVHWVHGLSTDRVWEK